MALGVVGLPDHVLELLRLGRGQRHQLLAADGVLGEPGVAVAVAAQRQAVVVADRGVPGDVEAGAVELPDRGGQIARQMREAELLVGVAGAGVGLPVLLEAAVLDAFVVARVPGVGGDAAAAHDGEEPVQLGAGVVVRVVAGRHGELERGAGGGGAPQGVDPLDERDRARHGQRLLGPPGVHVGRAQVLQAHRVLAVHQMQVGELHERGQRGTAAGPPGLRGGEVGTHLAAPAGAVAEAPVAGARARGGDGGDGGAAGVRGEGASTGAAWWTDWATGASAGPAVVAAWLSVGRRA